MAEEQQQNYEPLTDRELEILRLIADGLSNQQIASQLFLTLETVKWYNKQSFQKLGVGSRTQAIARARELGLFTGSAPGLKNNWLSQSMVFIGREAELAEIRTHLADPACRLLTLIGPGGIGKTRLAIEAARQQMPLFPGGVYFAPLASIESPAFIVRTIADTLGLVQTNQQPLLQIISYLRQRTILLVIDNFEHLLDGGHLLVELIAETRQVKLLVTSRERLHLKDEWLFDVQGLRYPPPDLGKLSSTDPTHYEAVQLFLQTAQRVQPDFSPDASDWIQIAHICQLVGGMPLAIDLAASWARVLPCADIACEIEQGLDILKTTWRDVPERHRSVQAVLDQSWALLSETERTVFSRLTVFSGSFQREAAGEIADATLSNLLELVDKSFLGHTAPGRFVIHELLKQYGTGKLQQDGEGAMQARLRHCRYYATYLYERMRAADNTLRLDKVEQEFDDIQAAWRWAVAHHRRDEMRLLALGFLVYYGLQSWYRAGSDAIGLYQRALESFGPDPTDSDHHPTVACLYESLGHLHKLSGAPDQAMNYYRQALAHTDQANAIKQAGVYRQIGNIYVMLNDHEQALAAYMQAQSLLDQVIQQDTTWWQEWTHIQIDLMNLYYWGNRVEDMIDLNHRIGPLIDQHASSRQRVPYLNAVAMMFLRRDRYFNSGDAITASAQALALSLETGNQSEIAYNSFQQGFSRLWSNHLDEADKYLRTARDMAEQNGDLTLLARALTYLTVLYRKRGDAERVKEYANESLRVAAEAHMPQYTGTAHAAYAWLAWHAADITVTIREAQTAIEDWGGLGAMQTVMPFRWLVLFPLLGVALQQQDIAKAIRFVQQLLLPAAARLPDDLTQLLVGAVTAWEQELAQKADDQLRQAFRLASEMRYI